MLWLQCLLLRGLEIAGILSRHGRTLVKQLGYQAAGRRRGGWYPRSTFVITHYVFEMVNYQWYLFKKNKQINLAVDNKPGTFVQYLRPGLKGGGPKTRIFRLRSQVHLGRLWYVWNITRKLVHSRECRVIIDKPSFHRCGEPCEILTWVGHRWTQARQLMLAANISSSANIKLFASAWR